jgi:hypothetical protein
MKALVKDAPCRGAAIQEMDVQAIRGNELRVMVKRAAIYGTGYPYLLVERLCAATVQAAHDLR